MVARPLGLPGHADGAGSVQRPLQEAAGCCNYPNIERPYRSPVGVWGAAVAGVIALISLISLYSNVDYRPGVYGTLIYFVLGVAYFAIAGRHRLVLSPEEEFALTRGEHGHPEREGYGSTRVTDIDPSTTPPAAPPEQAPRTL